MIAPGTLSRAIEAWQQLLAGPRSDVDELIQRCFSMPVLLRPDVFDHVIVRSSATEDDFGRALAAVIRGVQLKLASHPSVYRVGLGPVEGLWAARESGRLDTRQALTMAVSLPVTETLTPGYVRQLLSSLEAEAADHTTWRLSRERGELVRAAYDACQHSSAASMRLGWCAGLVRWAHGSLVCVPDGALLQEADRAGTEWLALLSTLRESGGAEPSGDDTAEAHFAIAVLWGDPYTAGRSSTAPDREAIDWRARGVAELTDVDGRDPASWEMPSTVDALGRAVGHWRAARELEPDSTAVLGGLAEALFWRALMADERVDDEARTAVEHGLELLALHPDDHAGRARLRNLAALLDVELPDQGDRVSGVADVDSDTLAQRYDNQAALIVLQEFHSLRMSEPQAALAVFDQHRDLVLAPGALSDDVQRTLWQYVAYTLCRAYGLDLAREEVTLDTDFPAHVDAVLTDLDQAAAEPRKRAASILALVASAGHANAESTGLRLVDELTVVAPLSARRYSWVIESARAELLHGEGVNAYQRDDRSSGLRLYGRALSMWIRQERVGTVRDVLHELSDIAPDADASATIELLNILREVAPEIATHLGSTADKLLDALMARLLGAMVENETLNSEDLWAHAQFSRGLRTAIRGWRSWSGTMVSCC